MKGIALFLLKVKILDGYIKLINPQVYHDIIRDSYFRGQDAIPIMVTGFGDIITWEEKKYIGLVRYRKGKFNIISSGFK